jgi:hypothetical protein
MIIRNDNITEATIAETDFDPTTFTDIAEFWISDFGVDRTGNVLNSWTGKLNGNVFESIDGNKGAVTTSDSDFNGYPSLSSSLGYSVLGYRTTITAGTVNKTYIMVGRITSRVSTATINWLGDSNMTSNDVRFDIHCDETTTALASWTYGTPDGSPVFLSLGTRGDTNDYFITMINYQIPTGTIDVYSSNTSTALSKTRTYNGRSTHAFNIIGWGGVGWPGSGVRPYGNNAQFKMVEAVVINGTPTSQELTAYTTYLNKRYGI